VYKCRELRIESTRANPDSFISRNLRPEAEVTILDTGGTLQKYWLVRQNHDPPNGTYRVTSDKEAVILSPPLPGALNTSQLGS
jgi:hypothetical protein